MLVKSFAHFPTHKVLSGFTLVAAAVISAALIIHGHQLKR